MTACGPGPQCPALSNARYGFHVPGDTYGSNRLIDTLLSGTVPIFTVPEQYNVIPDWIDWTSLSYFANVSSNQATFLTDIDDILADTNGYKEKKRNVVLNQDLFDWKTIIPFDTYMYMLSVHLWPELEMERRRNNNNNSNVSVSSPYTALILPSLNNDMIDNQNNKHGEMTRRRPIFRAFDFDYKNVYCGGANRNARTCEECQYLNGQKSSVEGTTSSSRRIYWKQALSDYYWTYYGTPNLSLRKWWKWESDPRACGGSCMWTGTKCAQDYLCITTKKSQSIWEKNCIVSLNSRHFIFWFCNLIPCKKVPPSHFPCC
jgi:hypothetical protein